MKAAFDDVAESYDSNFTKTLTGRLQRNHVWKHLDKHFPGERPINILELNCGTGEDAIHLARAGHQVVATDLSMKMIEIASGKVNEGLLERVRFSQFNMLDISKLYPQKFDLIFSNFGGINCLSPIELHSFLDTIPNLLKPKGRFIAVIMPKFCLVESLYFLLKLNFSKVFRRNSKNFVDVRLNGSTLSVWYYSAKDIRSEFKTSGKLINQKGIGIFVPPSYLDSIFPKIKIFTKLFGKIDGLLSKFSSSANFADHFLIDIEMKK